MEEDITELVVPDVESSMDLPDFNTASPKDDKKRPIVEENVAEQFVPNEEQAPELPDDDKMEIDEEPVKEKVWIFIRFYSQLLLFY